ncbi:hypothetical protein CKW39_09575 [Kocuria sp. WRN011]|uniref:PASTA domain-containing protein n=1 Tax=Kocuria sp. WRN011 TaxID=2029858 RepID=UPI000BB03805|nr:PASTA domain-containing protein [Kocuria sp. WRN011]PBB08068.1 hypothetical protein CKW39_09575 [Kocuria sp. WRN011]
MSIKTKLTTICLLGSIALVGCGNSESEENSEGPASGESQQASQVKVPDVKDKTLYEAITALREVKLNYEVSNEDFDSAAEKHNTRDWVVEEQSKKAGDSVPARDTVTLTVKKK